MTAMEMYGIGPGGVDSLPHVLMLNSTLFNGINQSMTNSSPCYKTFSYLSIFPQNKLERFAVNNYHPGLICTVKIGAYQIEASYVTRFHVG